MSQANAVEYVFIPQSIGFGGLWAIPIESQFIINLKIITGEVYVKASCKGLGFDNVYDWIVLPIQGSKTVIVNEVVEAITLV